MVEGTCEGAGVFRGEWEARGERFLLGEDLILAKQSGQPPFPHPLPPLILGRIPLLWSLL